MVIFFVIFSVVHTVVILLVIAHLKKCCQNQKIIIIIGHQAQPVTLTLVHIHSSEMFQTFVNLLLKIQGRDKLSKFLIHALKLIDAIRSIINKQPNYQLERVGIRFQKARQIMRMGKFITEYYSVIKLIREETKDEFGRLVRILCHCIYSFYWVADNITVLASYDLLYITEYQIHQSAMTIKFIALCIAAFLNLRSWFRLHHAEIKGRRQLKYLKGAQNLKKSKEIMRLVNEQWKMFLLCLKIYADMLPSIARSVIAKKILKIKIPRIAQALGGLINAFVACLLVSL